MSHGYNYTLNESQFIVSACLFLSVTPGQPTAPHLILLVPWRVHAVDESLLLLPRPPFFVPRYLTDARVLLCLHSLPHPVIRILCLPLFWDNSVSIMTPSLCQLPTNLRWNKSAPLLQYDKPKTFNNRYSKFQCQDELTCLSFLYFYPILRYCFSNVVFEFLE